MQLSHLTSHGSDSIDLYLSTKKYKLNIIVIIINTFFNYFNPNCFNLSSKYSFAV